MTSLGLRRVQETPVSSHGSKPCHGQSRRLSRQPVVVPFGREQQGPPGCVTDIPNRRRLSAAMRSASAWWPQASRAKSLPPERTKTAAARATLVRIVMITVGKPDTLSSADERQARRLAVKAEDRFVIPHGSVSIIVGAAAEPEALSDGVITLRLQLVLTGHEVWGLAGDGPAGPGKSYIITKKGALSSPWLNRRALRAHFGEVRNFAIRLAHNGRNSTSPI